jgi:hypothetical protein
MASSKRLRRRRFIVVPLVVLLSACGGAAGGPTPTYRSAATPATAVPSQPLPADIPSVALTAAAGDVIGSGEITPWDGGTVRGQTADGTTYTLDVAPLAVARVVTVEIRPVTGTTDLGPVIGGADFAPAGLQLLRPATLTIDGPHVPANWVGLVYRGSVKEARANLQIAPRRNPGALALQVTHFSGTVAVDVGQNANQLYQTWVAARGDATPTGRQAAAETRYAAADLAEHAGTISAETAAGIRASATADWMQAESDRLTTDPALIALADAGNPADMDVLAGEVARIVDFEAARNANGDTTAAAGIGKAVDIVSRYEDAIVKKVIDSPAVQQAATSGLVADLDTVVSLIGVATGLDRSIQLLGGKESTAVVKVFDLMIKIRDSLLASCANAPLDPALLLGLERMAQLVGAGTEVSLAALQDCLGTVPPPTPRPAAQRIEGTLTFDAQQTLDGVSDEWNVVIDARIQADSTETLAFAAGSHATVSWAGGGAGESCPTSAKVVETIGTPSGSGVNEVSDPHPDRLAIPYLAPSGDLTIEGLWMGLEIYATTPLGDCRMPQVSVQCDSPSRIAGKLIAANPRTWTFVCSATLGGVHATTGGHLTQLN